MGKNPESRPDLITITTNAIVNDSWVSTNPKMFDIVNSVPNDFDFKNFVEDCDRMHFGNSKHYLKQNIALAQEAFLYVVSETVYNYPSPFVTEKAMKPITSKRPFVVVGPVGALADLHSMGFKTFSDYWNEDYDTITDADERLLAVVDIIEWVSGKSIEDLRNLCISMQDVLNYNFNFYVNQFRPRELQHLEQFCVNNLKPRFN